MVFRDLLDAKKVLREIKLLSILFFFNYSKNFLIIQIL